MLEADRPISEVKKGKSEIDDSSVIVTSSFDTPKTTPGFNTPVTTPGYDSGTYELPSFPASRIMTASLEQDTVAASAENMRKARLAEYIGFGALLWAMFMEGWNDGTSGPMLPTIQKHYHIGFAVVSLVFVMNCVGFVCGAFANVHFAHKYGFGASPAPPFPVFAMAYIFSGFGMALQVLNSVFVFPDMKAKRFLELQNAQAMVFVVSLNNSATKMGIIHATYGIGALVAPLVATRFASMPHWSFHYFASLGGALVDVIFLVFVFRFQRLEAVLTKTGQTVREQGSAQGNLYSQILRLKVVHLFAFFVLVYIGVEVTIGGWIVTFVIDERGGGSSSGYLTSGFFAGLTLGRVGLLWLNKLVGERRVIWLYISVCISLEIVIWLVPSLIGNAIAVSFVGLFLGPIYPIVMNKTGRLVPHWLMSGAVGWIAGLGMTGSALLPFITGAMASKFGVMSLQPLIVTAMGIMVCLWAIVPPEMRRSE
ncbi:MFS general substrate transporter [Phellopilus nigrolimitatus]|nr:MFS general substrate transporter [Phellopilus nigrolimitatus]